MNIADLSRGELTNRLKGPGLRWRSGPFSIHLKNSINQFTDYLTLIYGGHPVIEEPWKDIADFHIQLTTNSNYRRFWRPQVFFQLDGVKHLAPFPRDHAPPMFEWGWNFSIAGRANHFLILHNAVIAKGDRAMLLPGIPGSGKSTLCAAMALKGWRLLSDEFALLQPESGLVFPTARPVALKNQSIEIIRDFSKDALLGPDFSKTRKGTVAHMRPPDASIKLMEQPARPTWVVSPSYQEGQSAILEQIPKEHAFLLVAANAFNYETLGDNAFKAVARVVRESTIFNFRYSNLEEAVATLEMMTQNDEAQQKP
ncbi:MAG: HprK-related kinase A [Magnetococcales bacterium]|nr:HprK-related kinase A [Magnetococcales bacterium]